MTNRPLARLRASIGGNFWLPCPVCGRMFGGHETKDRHGVLAMPGTAADKMTCPDCPHYYVLFQGRPVIPRVKPDGEGWYQVVNVEVQHGR